LGVIPKVFDITWLWLMIVQKSATSATSLNANDLVGNILETGKATKETSVYGSQKPAIPKAFGATTFGSNDLSQKPQ
jgi:hypothetical protein